MKELLKPCPFCNKINNKFSSHEPTCFIRMLLESVQNNHYHSPENIRKAYQTRAEINKNSSNDSIQKFKIS